MEIIMILIVIIGGMAGLIFLSPVLIALWLNWFDWVFTKFHIKKYDE